MTRQLHFGCGPNRLPAPWENYDREVDISERLPFPNASARLLFAEHVIEHVPFLAGGAFLAECFRVLEPGGVLRFAFPDVENIMFSPAEDKAAYLEFVKARGYPAKDLADALRFLLFGSDHVAAWTGPIGTAAARAAGFSQCREVPYGTSEWPELAGIDGHHRWSSVAIIETTVLEATK